MKKHMPIENQLFTWTGWDEVDNLCIQFYGCVAVKDFGPFKKGEELGIIVMDYENSELTQWEDKENGKKLRTLNLLISVE